MSTREKISSYLEGTEALFLEPSSFDEAIVGIAERAGGLAAVAYDRSACIAVLVRDGMTIDEAEEWFEFNTASAYVGPGTPIFVDTRYAE